MGRKLSSTPAGMLGVHRFLPSPDPEADDLFLDEPALGPRFPNGVPLVRALLAEQKRPLGD